jgi:O-antigen ligase
MIALLMLVLIAGFYLLREHWSHVAGNWIYLLLMACPLMHLFHGHGGHGNHDNDRSASGPRGGKEG